MNDRQIALVQFPILDLLVHDPEGFGVFCCNDNAAGVPVNTVAEGGGKGMLLTGLPFPLGIEISLNMVDEGASVFCAVVRMNCHTGLFIHQKNVFILIYNI